MKIATTPKEKKIKTRENCRNTNAKNTVHYEINEEGVDQYNLPSKHPLWKEPIRIVGGRGSNIHLL